MKYAILTLSGSYRETGSQSAGLAALRSSKRFRFDRFLLSVERIRSKSKVERVLVEWREDFQPRLFGGAEAVREQLLRLTNAGKETWFYAKNYDQLTLYVASACKHRIIHPLGNLSCLGVARPFIFFKQTLSKTKIDAVVLRRGEYKSAGDRFRTDSLDPANREQYEAFLSASVTQMETAIRSGCHKSKEELKSLQKGRILSAEAAIHDGWVDDHATLDRLESEWKQEKAKRYPLKKLGNAFGRGRKKIALLIFDGAIIDGDSRAHPLLGDSIGERSYLPVINKIRNDKSIVGVVFRINSGGGSATASEELLQALEALKEKKRVVVSMSELAGSGGYWIALVGERLFAQATTLTGSIGVITIALGLQKFLKRLGITSETIKTAPHADLGSTLRSSTKEERQLLQKSVDSLYESFLKRVAAARKMSLAQVEAAARGRVYSGSEALQTRLVDEIGGVSNAVEYLRSELNLKRSKVVIYPELKRSLLQRLLLNRTSASAVTDLVSDTIESVVTASPKNLALMPHVGSSSPFLYEGE